MGQAIGGVRRELLRFTRYDKLFCIFFVHAQFNLAVFFNFFKENACDTNVRVLKYPLLTVPVLFCLFYSPRDMNDDDNFSCDGSSLCDVVKRLF